MFCAGCGSKMDDEDRFCSTCGKPAGRPQPGICRKCGAKLEPGDKFCSACGTPLNVTADIVSRQSPPVVQAAEPVPEPVPVAEEKTPVVEPEEDVSSYSPEEMYEKGVYYDSLDNNDLINNKRPQKIALEWYERAADAGHVGGIVKICDHRMVSVKMHEMTEGPQSAKVVEEKRGLLDLFEKGIKLIGEGGPGTGSVDTGKLEANADRVRYSLAYSYYSRKEYEPVLELVRNREDMAFKVMEAVVTFEMVNEGEDYSEAMKCLSVILNNSEYGTKDKPESEELVYVAAVNCISGYYLKSENDTKQALFVLNYVRPFLKWPKAINQLDDKLSRFSTLGSGKVVYKDDDGRTI